jgi:hypothetical protein
MNHLPMERPRAGRKKCNIRSVAGSVREALNGTFRQVLVPLFPMKKKPSHPADAIKKKLHTRIASAQKEADAAKKAAKLAKLAFRGAKQKYKDARRAAKKLRRAVKQLKQDLAALAVRKSRRRPAAKKAAVIKPTAAPVAAPALVVAPAAEPTTPLDPPPAAQ